jgi:hypothetical protein
VSGFTRGEFCARNEVALNTFNRYMRRYGGRRFEGDQHQQLVAVEIADARMFHAEVAVVLARGRRVEVARGFDAQTLQRVVAALESY